ncbi:MAG: hypothetical protein P0116_14900 [Candidatus Nitrosocosmicus sp.]|nr:hypothetical protein [Candidatus Nitrosocosmicus sp.]
MNLQNTEIERESIEKDILTDIGIPEAYKDNDKEINKVINIHQIADRIHDHSDTWACKTCDHKGDKWELLSHLPYCKNSKK